MTNLIDRIRARCGFPPASSEQPTPAQRLAATMQPDEEYRRRRLRALSPARARRYHANVAAIFGRGGADHG